MKIELQVSGKKYKGWENIAISKSMQSIADTFAMKIFKGDIVNIDDDDVIKILVDDKVFLTGYLDGSTLTISDTKQPLSINGRSKTGDLIDCNILDNKQYNKQNIKQIINDLISPFNLTVSTSLQLEPLEKFDTNIGETYFNAINRLCKQTNTLPISDEFGNIQIVKNEQTLNTKVYRDSDFKSITYPKSRSNRFSSYKYKKEGIVVDDEDGTIEDDTVTRFRPFVSMNTEDKSNEDMAKWKKNNDQINAVQLKAVVNNWDLKINTIIKIETEVVNSSFLIKDIQYSKGDSGTISSLTLVSKDLYV